MLDAVPDVPLSTVTVEAVPPLPPDPPSESERFRLPRLPVPSTEKPAVAAAAADRLCEDRVREGRLVS